MLTVEEIKEITFGTVDIRETEDGWVQFMRMTDVQVDRAEKRDRPIRPYATAGVRIDIEGDVQNITFDYSIFPGSSRHFYGIDICENGQATFHVYEEKNRAISSVRYTPASAGRITIYFPNLAAMQIKNLNIQGTYRPHVYEKRFLVEGDSITQGYDAIHPMNSYVNRMMRALNYDCVNQAIGGDRHTPLLLDENDVRDYDGILVAYGTNDWWHCDPLKDTCEEFYRKLRALYPSMPVYTLLPIWRGDCPEFNENGETLQDARDLIAKIAEKYGATVLSGKDFVPAEAEMFSSYSLLHPNDDGFLHYTENLLSAIKPLL